MPLFLQLDLMFPVLLVLLHWYPTCVHGTLQYIDFLYLFLPKVMGTDCATYFSCDDQNHPEIWLLNLTMECDELLKWCRNQWLISGNIPPTEGLVI